MTKSERDIIKEQYHGFNTTLEKTIESQRHFAVPDEVCVWLFSVKNRSDCRFLFMHPSFSKIKLPNYITDKNIDLKPDQM
jgi:hypothetical protein